MKRKNKTQAIQAERIAIEMEIATLSHEIDNTSGHSTNPNTYYTMLLELANKYSVLERLSRR